MTEIVASEWFDLPGSVDASWCFAIGDVHGCARELRALQIRIGALIETQDRPAEVIYLGDYTDRGPDSRGALEAVRKGLRLPGVTETALRGNHDQYLLDAATAGHDDHDPEAFYGWMLNGGEATLLSLGADAAAPPSAIRAALGPDLLAFLRETRFMLRRPGLVFVHAGLNPLAAIDDQYAQDLIWIRDPFLDCEDWPFGEIVVHGHTPDAFGVFGHRIGVDSGCFASGVLTALELDGRRGRFHQTVP